MIVFRPATAQDTAFLQDVLAIAADWRDAVPRPASEVMDDPHLARYVADWPRAGDAGFVAEENGAPVGAAWYRRFDRDDAGYGFVDERTPELSIGVIAPARGRGVGSQLLRALIEQARRSGVPALSLSVETGNPAASLYRRLGFREVSTSGGAITMVLPLHPGEHRAPHGPEGTTRGGPRSLPARSPAVRN